MKGLIILADHAVRAPDGTLSVLRGCVNRLTWRRGTPFVVNIFVVSIIRVRWSEVSDDVDRLGFRLLARWQGQEDWVDVADIAYGRPDSEKTNAGQWLSDTGIPVPYRAVADEGRSLQFSLRTADDEELDYTELVAVMADDDGGRDAGE